MYGKTRINVPVGIAYKEQIAEAREVLLKAVRKVEGVLEDPTPTVVAIGLGDSSVNLEVRVWISDASQERPIFFRVMETVKVSLDAAEIEIPFPHLQLFVENVEERVWKQAARFPGIGTAEKNGDG
jgi:small-conductance mechanosensitive channel